MSLRRDVTTIDRVTWVRCDLCFGSHALAVMRTGPHGRDRSLADRWCHEDLEDVFRTIGNETRLEVLGAIFEADEAVVPFSEIKDRVSIRDSGNLAYHLDRLAGRFVEHVDGEGYALSPAAYHVLYVVLTDVLGDGSTRLCEPIGEACPTCTASLRITYDGNRASIECHGCETVFKRRTIHPTAVRSRDPSGAATVVDACVRSDLRLLISGVCPYCQGHAQHSLIPETTLNEAIRAYERDETDGAYVQFECHHCTASFVVPAAMLLYELPDAASYFADHGTRLRSVPFWRTFAWNADGGATVSEDEPRLHISVMLEDESLTVAFDEALRPVEVTRTREYQRD